MTATRDQTIAVRTNSFSWLCCLLSVADFLRVDARGVCGKVVCRPGDKALPFPCQGTRADPNFATCHLGETPLTCAAAAGAAVAAQMLICAGALVDKPRTIDGARPLDIAVDASHCKLAITLLSAGAEAVPSVAWRQLYGDPQEPPRLGLRPQDLVCNTILCEGKEGGAQYLLLKMLSNSGAPLDEIWPETGETALHMAVGFGELQVRWACVHTPVCSCPSVFVLCQLTWSCEGWMCRDGW